LTAKAERADSVPLAAGLTVAEEIKRREERKAVLTAAREVMEARYKAAEEERTQDDPKSTEDKGGKRTGKKKPLDTYQYNFTDPESRIMKVSGDGFEQCYNAQAAVDTESMLIVGGYVTSHCNDKQELAPLVASVDPEIATVDNASADTGFYSEEAVQAVEKPDAEGKRQGPEVFCAVERTGHHRSVQDLEAKRDAGEPLPETATAKERMAHKLKSERGRAIYKKRKETVEPVFGVIKSVMGFRQFLLRGLEKVNLEWELVKTAYNFKKLHRLVDGRGVPCRPAWAGAGR
jgi:hypothetical protein